MSNGEDTIPLEYQYAWSPESSIPLEEFLTKYKPSMVQNDGTKPWLWVRRSKPAKEDYSADQAAAVEEATALLQEVTEKVDNIKNDDSIPVRANKKKGTKSKKELREAVQSEAAEKLKDIAVRHGYVHGKWLIFAPSDKVDLVWSTIAKSLVSGFLASTRADVAKVATSPQDETPNYSHVLCLYVPNVYDKQEVTEIMKILLRQHGMNLMGVKADLYTSIGLDSKHPSGIPSTVWKNTALLPDTEIKVFLLNNSHPANRSSTLKKLKDEFFAELKTGKSADKEKTAVEKAPTKQKPKLKKKAGEDNPFASDEEDPLKEQPAPAQPSSSKSEPRRKSVPQENEFVSDEDRNEKEDRGKKRKAKVTRSQTDSLKKASDDYDDNEEEERPQKKRLYTK
ncbi:uncharacterized protein LAESUDRAFT_477749 [Laetiporus sulphureus 93-53]|uniref:DUF1917-domain-containing protein n=1 Tax=Laetiporus sulphureus 93-53 TaxID=1314785 RepID=A0A165BQA0_9APHY|nr:uncharacterized protein LAESUDRAFT_477749 [Laetiporus sulphureus 93-53]KZT01459.1 hypothetical protein LAESUDRAFT_477749 [Laetiporus sulphureus 93-53]